MVILRKIALENRRPMPHCTLRTATTTTMPHCTLRAPALATKGGPDVRDLLSSQRLYGRPVCMFSMTHTLYCTHYTLYSLYRCGSSRCAGAGFGS
jgi:hypothetical protein